MKGELITLFGFPLAEVRKETGLKFGTIYRHAHGQCRISPECAIKYHDALGVPLSEIRPDIWRPSNGSSTS